MAQTGARTLATGVREMDDEHWGLLTVLTQLRAAVEAGAGRDTTAALVGQLHRRSTEHFATEERLMRERRYPMASSHVAQHNRFLAQLSQWTEPTGPSGGRAAVAAPPAITGRQVRELEAWFARHVEIADQPLADWLLQPHV